MSTKAGGRMASERGKASIVTVMAIITVALGSGIKRKDAVL